MPLRNIPSVLIPGILFIHFSIAACAQQSDPGEFFTVLNSARQFTTTQKWKEAVDAWEQVVERNPVNGEYIARLGEAYYYIAQYAKSIDAYKKQIELGYGNLYIAAYNIACCYSLAGEKENALQWLQKSFDMGFRSYTVAQKDADFNNISSDPRFKKIVALEDISKMNRTEGWRYDLEILKREVMRKAYLRRELSFDEFNKQYKEIYNSIDKKTDVQLIMAFMKLMATVNDGHSAIFAPSRKEFQLAVPLQFYHFKEGLYIVAADEKHKHLLGAKVLGFEKKTVDEVNKALSPILARDNEMGVLYHLAGLVRYPLALQGAGLISNANALELQLMDGNGKKFTASIEPDMTTARVDQKSVPVNWVTLNQVNGKPIPLYLKNTKTYYWFEQLPNKVLYLQWNAVVNDKAESLRQFTDRLFKYINDNEIEKLVIDLRWNNGGNTMLLPYFINSIIRSDKINKRGNLFVITGRRTFSAAQNLSTYLEQRTNSIFVGEPTGSNPNFVGEEDFITLPYSQLAMNVSDLFWQSSWPGDHRIWIAPSIYIPPTFKAYNENRDECLDAIIKLVTEKKAF
jgi:tetratricopeptide (TPR) repeat protein